jgi:hypothetical protein
MSRLQSAMQRGISIWLAAWLAVGCAASVSPIQGLYPGGGRPGAEERPVRVEFTVAHLTQRHGFDAVPKHRGALVADFEEVFRDATREIGNLSAYTLKTETAPLGEKEVVLRPDYRTDHDYSVRMVFLSESSFASDVLAGIGAFASLTLLPVPFRVDYTASAEVRSPDGRLLASYSRSAEITQWVQGLLIFAYPFRPPEGEQEKLVSRLLHDLFREMAAAGVLAGDGVRAPASP